MLLLTPTEGWTLKGKVFRINIRDLFEYAYITRTTLNIKQRKNPPKDDRLLQCNAASLGDIFPVFRKKLLPAIGSF
jgi:hypothetical protein